MRRFLPLLALAAVGLAAGSARAQGPERPAVDRGLAFLRSQINQMEPGYAAISALAMIKAEVPLNDPGLVACLSRFGTTFADGPYKPFGKTGADIYEAAMVVIALVNIDAEGYKPQIDAVAKWIIAKQMANGAWDYTHRTQGDTSIGQYALLGLWEAENAGIAVPPEVWDRAATWFLGVQSGAGSWNYHRDEAHWPETISMTGAGVGSLMLCQRQLARHRKGQDLINPLMTPVSVDGQDFETRYKVTTTAAAINSGVQRGMAWLTGRFQINNSDIMGQSAFYALYGIERVAALSEPKGTFGNVDWYNKGLAYILANQKETGAWDAVQHGAVANTCWAILFSVKSTQNTLKKIEIRKLGAGALRGGVGLPSDLNNVEIVNGQIMAKPMGGAIEGMLAILEDVKPEGGDSALAGLVAKYQTDGPKSLRPYKDRFRKLLKSPDPGIRAIGAWGLGRTGDLDVAPALMKALLDNDDDVVLEARIGLQVLSRKLDGYGPERGDDPEKRKAAAQRWAAWFQSVKPPDLDAPEEIVPSAAPSTGGGAP